MTVVSIDDAKRHLNISSADDDVLIEGKIKAAEAHVSRLLGFSVETGFEGGVTPDDIKEAILQLVAHWYENREATVIGAGVQYIPFSVQDIIREHRGYGFDG